MARLETGTNGASAPTERSTLEDLLGKADQLSHKDFRGLVAMLQALTQEKRMAALKGLSEDTINVLAVEEEPLGSSALQFRSFHTPEQKAAVETLRGRYTTQTGSALA